MTDSNDGQSDFDDATDAARLAEQVADVRSASADARIADAEARIVDADAQTRHAKTGMAAASAHMRAARAHMDDADTRESHALELMAKADEQMRHAAELIANMHSNSAEYDRAVKHYTQLVRHRIANPLQTICGMTHTLRDHPELDPARRIEMIAHIHEQAKALKRVSLEPRRVDHTERELDPRPGTPVSYGNEPREDHAGFLAPIPPRVPAAQAADHAWVADRDVMERTIALVSEIVLQPTLHECAQVVAQSLASIVGVDEIAFAGEDAYAGVRVGNPPRVHDARDEGAPEWICASIPNPFVADAAASHGVLWARAATDATEQARIRDQLTAAARHIAAPMGALAERKRLRRQLRSEHGLVDAGKVLARERTLKGVLQRIIELACELVDARYGALGVLDADGFELEEFITVGMDAATHAAIGDLPTGRGILGVLITDAEPLRLTNLGDDPRSVGFPPNHPPMTSFLGVPMIARGKVTGRIYLTEKRGADRFSEEDERVVVALASQAAIAIQNAELYEDFVGTTRELVGANTTLERADLHKSAFLTNMSHELRTPLNSIIGYATLLIEDGELNAEQRDDLGVIRASGSHLLALITDLLDLSKIEAGTLALRPIEVDIARLLRDAARSLKPQVERSGVELVVEAPDVAHIECDRSRVRQILLNILANAVKFTTEGSIFATLRVQADAGVTIEIHDTGPGIPEEDLPRLFEPFFQSGAALARTPRASEGAGLGLAISRMLARAHGGTVEIDSHLGDGTTVTIHLPRHAKEATFDVV